MINSNKKMIKGFEYKALDTEGICQIVENAKEVFIYGAGNIGQMFKEYLNERGLADRITAFLISETEREKNIEKIDGIPVKVLNEVIFSEEYVIFLATSRMYRSQLQINCRMIGLTKVVEVKAFDDRNYEYYSNISERLFPVELEYWYWRKSGRKLNLEKPETFNEKINWSKINDRSIRKTTLSDKYKVREWVKEKIGEEYLVPLLGVWKTADEIDFCNLPDRFVLKCNHGCGWNIIVEDKNSIDCSEIKEKLKYWLGRNYAYENGLELQYRDIYPLVIAEEFINTKEPGGLIDYKFFCFGGRVFCFYKMTDYTFDHSLGKMGFFDRNGNFLPYKRYDYACLGKMDQKLPSNFKDMICVAEKLSTGFDHVRVDMYDVEGNIYFGEMTFSTSTGLGFFEQEEFDRILGEQWIIEQ